ncbi:MAG: Hint domain-containing protein [Roseobacter sp.]
MARIALWTFDETSGASVATDSEVGDGTVQSGTFVGGASTNNSGAATFDGFDDYVEIPHDPGFELDTGSIVITFTQQTASLGDLPFDENPAQTLLSRDASGFDGGGHLTIFVRSDGSIGVRHQDTENSYEFGGGNVPVGDTATVTYTWSPTGSQLIVDGVVVDTGSQALTLAGNSEPITIGVSQANSDDNVANDLGAFFHGEIEGVALHDEVIEGGTIACFTKGTMILTPSGEVSVESLRVGDLVCTMNNGPQPIRWLGSRIVTLDKKNAGPDKLHPVRIHSGALGAGLPKRDLWVSRQHRMLISSKISERMFVRPNVLSAAVKMTALPGIYVDENIRNVEYFHLMFDQHEIVFAEGAPTESLYAGPEAMKAVPVKMQQEILSLFPELLAENWMPTPAFPILRGAMLKQLVSRHLKNKRPLLEVFEGHRQLVGACRRVR